MRKQCAVVAFLLLVAVEVHADFQRGVNWVAGGEVTAAQIAALTRINANWIAQTPFGWQRSLDDPEVIFVTEGRVYWGERDAGIEETTRLARAAGIRTLLKPHLWVRDGKWAGDIRMRSPAGWQKWFRSYGLFILHYAKLAERLKIEAFCVGTELRNAAIEHPREFRELIAAVRKVYHGRITYAANWHEEYDRITFWDALDFAGVQAYFPLSPVTSVDSLMSAWRPHVAALERFHARVRKPIVFTEVGYRSATDAAAEPWKWESSAAADLTAQANSYEALFRTFSAKPWLEGIYIWKWYPAPERSRRPLDRDFTPQGKPAEKVLARWFSR